MIKNLQRCDNYLIMIDCWFSPTKELIKANQVCAYLDICSKFLINAKHCYINHILMKVKKDNNSLKKSQILKLLQWYENLKM